VRRPRRGSAAQGTTRTCGKADAGDAGGGCQGRDMACDCDVRQGANRAKASSGATQDRVDSVVAECDDAGGLSIQFQTALGRTEWTTNASMPGRAAASGWRPESAGRWPGCSCSRLETMPMARRTGRSDGGADASGASGRTTHARREESGSVARSCGAISRPRSPCERIAVALPKSDATKISTAASGSNAIWNVAAAKRPDPDCGVRRRLIATETQLPLMRQGKGMAAWRHGARV
jgi:hypothetical protein